MKKKNKKYMIWAIVIVVLIIFLAIGFFAQNSQQSTSAPSQYQGSLVNQSGQNNLSSVTLAPPANTPKASALEFYDYFTSSVQNPLANGAYKNNPYLADDFKVVISTLYQNGNVPVFCPANKVINGNVAITKEQQVYYSGQYMTDEIISETTPVSKDLYRVRLENVGGKWLIFDINCIGAP